MINKILNSYTRPLVRDAVNTTVLSTVGKTVGFLIPFFIAAWFGVSEETDAFFFAYGLILFLSGIFAPVVKSVIVPYIAQARSNNEDVGKFVGGLLGISSIGMLVLTVLLFLVAKPVLSVVARFDEQALNLIFQLLLETSPLIVLLVWTSILEGALNTYKKFAFPAISPAFRAITNLIIIFTFKDKYGVHSIALGYIVGEIVRLTVLLFVTKQLNLFKLRMSFWITPKLMEFSKTASYQIIGMVAIGFNPIVDKTMASWLDKGSVSILHYADRLYMIPVTFMITGLMVTLLSHWSERYIKEGFQRLKKDVNRTVKMVTLLTLPITVFLIIFQRQIVTLAFGRGDFDEALLLTTGQAWVYYLLGFTPYIIGSVFLCAHLTTKNTKVIMQYGFYSVVLTILLNYILMRSFGVTGIALARTCVQMFFVLYLSKVFYNNTQGVR